MIAEGSRDILLSLLYSLIFGAFGGVLFSGLNVLFQYVETVLSLPKQTLYFTSERHAMRELFRKGIDITSSENGVKQFFKDMIFTVTYGVSFVILTYIASDGVFRLYVLLVALSVTYLSSKTLGRFLEKIFLKLFRFLCSVAVVVIALFAYPIRGIINSIANRNKILDKKR